jgi:hypothetical protein
MTKYDDIKCPVHGEPMEMHQVEREQGTPRTLADSNPSFYSDGIGQRHYTDRLRTYADHTHTFTMKCAHGCTFVFETQDTISIEAGVYKYTLPPVEAR